MFSAMAGDILNISRVDADGSNQVRLTGNSKDNYMPAATTDGRFVVFSSNRTGSYNIWRMNVEDGSDLKQLTNSDSNFYPAVSPDNHWVAYDKQQAKEKSVWKVQLEGGGNETKVADKYRMPAFSPDSQSIAARYDLISGTNETVLLNAANGEVWKQITTPYLDWQRVLWPSQSLTYIEKINGYPNIVSHDIASGVKKQLTKFNRNQIFSYAWSPDYKLLACQLGNRTSNVVRIRNDK
jgi:Tol biopolymer transport system component